MWSICKKEWSQFFSNLTGYLTIVLFLLINGLFLFVFPDASIFEYGYASLEKFFDLSPWIFLFLIPAISMRSLADEFKTGTFEIVKTKPITALQIALGKYFSILLITLVVLLPTGIYVYTINALSVNGQIDTGGIIGSYIGLFMLAAAYAAIGLFCSALSSNAVVAFLFSAFVCLSFYFGFNAISKIPALQGSADYYIEMLGIDFHYRSMSRGVLDTRDVFYFLSIISLSIHLTAKKLQHKK